MTSIGSHQVDDKQAKKAEHQREKQSFIQQEMQSGKTQEQAEADWKAQHPHHNKQQANRSSSSNNLSTLLSGGSSS